MKLQFVKRAIKAVGNAIGGTSPIDSTRITNSIMELNIVPAMAYTTPE